MARPVKPHTLHIIAVARENPGLTSLQIAGIVCETYPALSFDLINACIKNHRVPVKKNSKGGRPKGSTNSRDKRADVHFDRIRDKPEAVAPRKAVIHGFSGRSRFSSSFVELI